MILYSLRRFGTSEIYIKITYINSVLNSTRRLQSVIFQV